jgi:hypothetical protein
MPYARLIEGQASGNGFYASAQDYMFKKRRQQPCHRRRGGYPVGLTKAYVPSSRVGCSFGHCGAARWRGVSGANCDGDERARTVTTPGSKLRAATPLALQRASRNWLAAATIAKALLVGF